MPSCKEVASAVSGGEIQTAGFFRRLAIRLHLWICEPCRIYVRQMRQLGDAARRALGRSGDDLGELEKRVLERCADAAATAEPQASSDT